MRDLIKSLEIFSKYCGDDEIVTHCVDETMYIYIHPDKVTADDKNELNNLGFAYRSEYFYSRIYGTC